MRHHIRKPVTMDDVRLTLLQAVYFQMLHDNSQANQVFLNELRVQLRRLGQEIQEAIGGTRTHDLLKWPGDRLLPSPACPAFEDFIDWLGAQNGDFARFIIDRFSPRGVG